MADKNEKELSEASECEYGSNDMHDIVKSFVQTKYVNIIGGSVKKGAPIKGGQAGEK
jgi:hypothetical protein